MMLEVVMGVLDMEVDLVDTPGNTGRGPDIQKCIFPAWSIVKKRAFYEGNEDTKQMKLLKPE